MYNHALCFETACFTVRLLAKNDKAFYQLLYGSSQVMQYIGKPLSCAEASVSFNAALQHNSNAAMGCYPGSHIFMVIADIDTKEGIGLLAVTLLPVVPEAEINTVATGFNAEIGIMLLPRAQKTGLARAALAGLCKQLRLQPLLNHIYYCTAANNSAAKKLVTGLGFVYCEHGNCYQLPKK
jgi:RimJ/RimL family protein N-acetyltransferase